MVIITAVIADQYATARFFSLATNSPFLSNTLSGLDGQIRATNAALERVEVWLIAFTAILTFGLIAEIVEPWNEWWVARRYRKSGIGSQEYEATEGAKLITLVGGVFVLAGILGEFREQYVSLAYERLLTAQEGKRADISRADADAKDEKIKIANAVAEDARTRAEPRYIHCEKNDFANIRIPDKTEIVLASGVGDGSDFVFTFEECFRKIGWPEPTKITKLRPDQDVGAYAIRTFGVTIFDDGEFDRRDMRMWRPDPSDPNHLKPPFGTPQRALWDELKKTVAEVVEQTGLAVPHNTIRVIIAPKP